MLPSRATIIPALQRLANTGNDRTDEPSRYVGAECGIAYYALEHGTDAIARGDMVGATMYLRMLAEVALRVGWIAGDNPAGGPNGTLSVDRALAEERVRRLEKRDLMQLSAAYRAIAEVEPSPERTTLIGQLEDRARGIPDEPAPSRPNELAVSSMGRRVYVVHRLGSTSTHPGAVLGRMELNSPARLAAMLDEAGYICAVFGEAVMRTLALGNTSGQ